MNNAAPVSVGQTVAYLHGNVDGPLSIDVLLLDEIAQRLSLDILHREERTALVLRHFVYRNDIGVLQTCRGLSFPDKAGSGTLAGGQVVRKEL